MQESLNENCNTRVMEDLDLIEHTEYLFLWSLEISNNLYEWKNPLKEFLILHRLWRPICSLNKNHCLTLLSEDKKKANWSTASLLQHFWNWLYPTASWRRWIGLVCSCLEISKDLCSAHVNYIKETFGALLLQFPSVMREDNSFKEGWQ